MNEKNDNNGKTIYAPMKKWCFVRCDDCGKLVKYAEIHEIALTKDKICSECMDKRKIREDNKGYFFFYP